VALGNRQRFRINGKEAGSPDEGELLCGGRSPEQEALDVAAGWNKPAEPSAEQTVERLRKPEGGTKRGPGILANSGCARRCREEGRDPGGLWFGIERFRAGWRWSL